MEGLDRKVVVKVLNVEVFSLRNSCQLGWQWGKPGLSSGFVEDGVVLRGFGQ